MGKYFFEKNFFFEKGNSTKKMNSAIVFSAHFYVYKLGETQTLVGTQYFDRGTLNAFHFFNLL